MNQESLRAAARGFSVPPYEPQTKFTQLERRPGFPSWSWCGWQGHTGYFPRKVAQPDLHILQSIQSAVRWPWDPDVSQHLPEYKKQLEQRILMVYAWHAVVDFDKLPYGILAEANRRHWPGWPMDGEPALKHGEHECILLSTQLKHPVPWTGLRFEDHRILDPVGDVPLVNVMVLGWDNEQIFHRRGIGMMRQDVWRSFKPTWSLVRLS
jgi:hypothetical protein